MKKILLLIIGIMLVFTLSACGETEYTNISNEELLELLEDSDNYQFIDVRTSPEYYEGHIGGFIIIDYYMIDEDHSLLDRLDKDIPVVIMCNSGNRSVSASEIFVEEGFVEVYNLTDGIEGWDGATE
jgi:rhodanese-related sulfurtransferase